MTSDIPHIELHHPRTELLRDLLELAVLRDVRELAVPAKSSKHEVLGVGLLLELHDTAVHCLLYTSPSPRAS